MFRFLLDLNFSGKLFHNWLALNLIHLAPLSVEEDKHRQHHVQSKGHVKLVIKAKVYLIRRLTTILSIINHNYDTYHQNSDGEPTAFDHGKLAGSVPRRFQ